MVRKRTFTEDDLKGLPALPEGYEWKLFAGEPCISTVDDSYMAWITVSPYGAVGEELQYCWDYFPRYGERIRYREPVSFDDAINAITNLVWLNYQPRT